MHVFKYTDFIIFVFFLALNGAKQVIFRSFYCFFAKFQCKLIFLIIALWRLIFTRTAWKPGIPRII